MANSPSASASLVRTLNTAHAAPDRFWRQRKLWLGLLLVGLLATIPRLIAVVQMTTFVDEIYWLSDGHEALERLRALGSSDDPWGPRILRHPGVPAAIAGGLAEDTRNPAADRVSENERIIVRARMGVVWMGVLCCLVVAAFGARIYGLATGLMAGGILAISPFHIANSAWLQCDSALALFSITAVLAFTQQLRGGGYHWLLASAIAAGLAIASKLPGVLLAVWTVGACLITHANASRWQLSTLLRPGRDLVVWGALALITLYMCWPRMWTNPLALFETLLWARDVGENHINYFMGQILPAPPWYYYLVVIPFSLDEIEFVGILAAAGWVAFHWIRKGEHPSLTTWLLVAWAAIFLVAMSLAGKKLGARYVLPLWPVIALLVARVAVLGAERARMTSSRIKWPLLPVLTTVAIAGAAAGLAATRGDFFAYSNRLLGGLPSMDKVTLIVGVAERDVARYIDTLSNIGTTYIAGHILSMQWHARRALLSAPCEGLQWTAPGAPSGQLLVVHSYYERRCPAYSEAALTARGAREIRQFVWGRTLLARVYVLAE